MNLLLSHLPMCGGIGPVAVAMIWNLVVIGAIGLLLGFTFRAGALVATTLVAVAVCGFMKAGGGLFRADSLLFILEVVAVLQVAYLAGLALRALWRRARSD